VKVPVTEEDTPFVQGYEKDINEKGGWVHTDYKAVEKWEQVVNGQNQIYHLSADGDFKCTVYLHLSNLIGATWKVTRAEKGWIPIQ
jgi:hypothetical protein